MHGQPGEHGMDFIAAEHTAELEAHIQYRLGRQVHGFSLIIEEKGLILRGRARSYYAKQLAQHAVMQITRLQILANEIEVR